MVKSVGAAGILDVKALEIRHELKPSTVAATQKVHTARQANNAEGNQGHHIAQVDRANIGEQVDQMYGRHSNQHGQLHVNRPEGNLPCGIGGSVGCQFEDTP